MSKTLIIMVTLVTLVTLNQIAALWRYIWDPRYFGNYGNLGNSSSFFIFFVGGSTVLWQDGQMNKTLIIMVTMVTLITLNQIAALWRCVHKNAFQETLIILVTMVTLETFLGWDFSTSLWGPRWQRGWRRGCGQAKDRGVYLSRKPNFQLTHFLAYLIFSCHPILQEGEFSVVSIEMNPFQLRNWRSGENLHF